MKKILLFFLLIFPMFVNAVTYSSATTTAGNYMETGDFKYGYEKYIYTPTDNASFYNNDSALFKKGGMLNLEELKITLKNNTRSLYYSYLYEGNPYWTITGGSSSDYRKIVNGGFNEFKKTETATKIGTKVTEYVIPTTSVVGQGTYSDPFIFAPQYKVLIKVNNGERGVIVDEDNREVTSIEFLATESDYREIKIKSKGKYGYIGSTCGMILNDIQSSVGKVIVSGVSRDTECTINFGERPTAVILNQTENTTQSSPTRLYIIPENGWFSDEFANYTITTLSTNPSKTGYTYNGYYKSTSISNACLGTLVIGTDKKLIKTQSLLASFVKDQTLYPCYLPNTYTISFDLNTGDRLSTTTKSVVFDQNYGELPIPEKDGYNFDGWYTDAVSGELIESSTLMDLANNHTLYAHWRANTNTEYKVKHWLQNIGAGSEQNNTNYTEQTTTTHTGTSDTTVNAPRKTFSGFTQPASKSVTIDRHGTSIVNYYYTRNYYTITYNANGRGTPSFTSKDVQFGDGYVLPTISATGYTFDGWYTAASRGTKITSSTTITNASNHTLYAHWTINKYPITLNMGTGISAVSGDGSYDYNSIRNINATVKPGYTWSKWTGYTTTTTQAYSFNMPAQSVTLTANATGNPYSVVYNCNGGTGTRNATSHVYGTSSAVSTNFCTNTGHSFSKWTTEQNGNGTSVNSGANVTGLTTAYNGTVTLYAQWIVNNYTVAYNCNNGSGATASSSHTYGIYKNLTANGCTRAGHRFDGWSTNSSGTGTVYGNQESVVNLSTSNNATVTLYAKWTKCSAGTYLSGNSCVACSAGYYSAAGASACTKCSAGYFSGSGASSCSACSAGTYSGAGASSCTSCPAGKYSGSAASSCSNCAAGKYSTGGASSCSTCTAGYYCPGGTNRQQCSAGTYSGSGASSCTNCAAGKYSAAGASSCSNCSAGTYSTGGASSCSTCTAGYYCPGGTNRQQCSAGTYSGSGASSCTNCAAGKYSAAGASSCSNCAAGTYSTGGASRCSTCTAGYSCPGGTNRQQCSAGTYSSSGASSCTACTAGTYSGAGASSCTNCAAGKYSSSGASSCSTCTAGTYSTAGSSGCTRCAAGKYSAAGAGSCSNCAAGTYSTGGASSCTTCTAGYYCPGGSNRIQCGSGYTSSAGASSCSPSYTVKTGVSGSITGGSNYRHPYNYAYASTGWMSTMQGFIGRNGTYNYSYIVTFKTPGSTNDVTEKLVFKWWVASAGSTISSETYRYAIASSTSNKGSYANATGTVSDSYQLVQGKFTWNNILAASGSANYQTLTINTTALKGGTTYYLYLWPSKQGGISVLQQQNYSLSVNYRDY